MNKLYHRNYMRKWVRKNREQTRQISKSYRLSRHELIRYYKNRPCADCYGWFNTWQMQFDHVRGKKKFAIGRRCATTMRKLIAEIKKCDVVCANCHADRTYKRWHNET